MRLSLTSACDRRELPPLADVIARHGLRTKKSLGQHFLLDSGLTDQIVRLAGSLAGVGVIEVGPGPGGLTRSLLASQAREVIAIEKDERCIQILHEVQAHYGERLQVQVGDATRMAMRTLLPAPRAIVANLPYNVGTDLLIGWLYEITEEAGCYQQLLLMFQREVAERVVAAPGSKAYGRLSVLAQWLCVAQVVLHVPAHAFSPPPKVDSAVVQLVPRAVPLVPAQRASLEKVVAVAFGQRRKMLRASLKSLGRGLVEMLPALDIDPQARAEQLSVQQFCALANAWDASA